MNKEHWLHLWGYILGTPEAEAAWEAKINPKPQKFRYVIGKSANYEYSCPVTGAPISSKYAHEENLKQHNCRLLEEGEASVNSNRRALEDAELDKRIENTVEREIESYSSEKREKLYNELVHQGLDLVVERK